jgi:hypothetical protein
MARFRGFSHHTRVSAIHPERTLPEGNLSDSEPAKAIGSIRLGTLFLTLFTRGLTGQATTSSDG